MHLRTVKLLVGINFVLLDRFAPPLLVRGHG